MRHLKFILPLLALTLVLGVVFANKMQQAKTAVSFDPEWEYQGGPIDQPGSYILATTSPDCDGVNSLCSIKAPDNGNGEPVLPLGLEDEVEDMIANGQQTNENRTIFLKQ